MYRTIERNPAYEINAMGHIRNKKTGKTLNHHLNRSGYPCVNTYLGSIKGKDKQLKLLVHVELAKAFIPNPDNYPVVMHLDDDILNYSLDNLQWGTQQMNMQQSSSTGYYSTVKKTVELISPTGELVTVVGLRPFCAEYGLDWGNFSKMIKGKYKQHKGWRLAN